ncbi:MAG: septal ring lytic transglycosylase RlpA family protein [Gammaproteobacteria bacterium]
MNKIILAIPVLLTGVSLSNPTHSAVGVEQRPVHKIDKLSKNKPSKAKKTGKPAKRVLASWYGPEFHGKKTASGQTFDMYAMTAAHKTLPFMSYVEVTNPENKRSVIVRINDRGPFHHNRGLDLSYAAAKKIGITGVGEVIIKPLDRKRDLSLSAGATVVGQEG